jgi:HlyD family secretion protein
MNMKKRRKIIWISIAAVAVIGILWIWRAKRKAPEVVLVTETAHLGYIANAITATGTVQPVDTVAVGTQVSGTISKIYADFNSQVKKGQLLAELDKTVLNAQVQQVLGTVQQAQSQVAYQQENLSRQKQLYNAGAISKAELETAENGYRVANASLVSARSQMQAAQKNLSLTEIYSPIEGTVLSRNVNEGQTVAASLSAPTLFSIAKDLTHMQVRAAVDEADIGNVKQGQRVNFTVDAFPDDVFNGTVLDIRLQPNVSSNVVTYTTIIDAPNDQLKLKPGMTASISIYTKEADSVMLISARATKFKPDSSMMKKYTIVDDRRTGKGQQQAGKQRPNGSGGSYRHADSSSAKDPDSGKRASVWILEGTTLTRRSIVTGMEDGVSVQVLRGLTLTEKVVTGIEQSGATTTTGTQRSPFMPQRRGGQGGGNRGGNRPQ